MSGKKEQPQLPDWVRRSMQQPVTADRAATAEEKLSSKLSRYYNCKTPLPAWWPRDEEEPASQ